MTIREEKCEDCMYYKDGKCRRYPPSILSQEEYDVMNDVYRVIGTEYVEYSFFPGVDCDWWCGEYKTQ